MNNIEKYNGRRWIIFIPIAVIMYLLAFLDRTNFSFILPHIGADLHIIK